LTGTVFERGYSVVTRKQLMMWWVLMFMLVEGSFGER
jgi:hypothetical protein